MRLLPGALLNALVTFLASGLGFRLGAAALVGVMAALLWDVFVAAPPIWGVWRTAPQRLAAASKGKVQKSGGVIWKRSS